MCIDEHKLRFPSLSKSSEHELVEVDISDLKVSIQVAARKT